MAREFISVDEARAFVEANYQGDPLIKHMFKTLVDKLPRVEAVPVRDSKPMFLLKHAPEVDADMLKALENSPVIYSANEETIIPIMPDRYIPVTERIPTRSDADPDHEKVMAYSIQYKAWRIEHFTWVANHPDWYTHWMPMPMPPKEET